MSRFSRRSSVFLLAIAILGLVLMILDIPGVTNASWRSELTTQGAIADAAVLFEVNGQHATATEPTVGVDLGPAEAQALLDEGKLAIPVEVKSLSQGNPGLRYEVELPDTDENSILHRTNKGIFPVSDPGECTVDTAIPTGHQQSSVPVPATYSDSTIPVIEFWCLRADLSSLHDLGTFTSQTTISAEHSLGETFRNVEWEIDVRTPLTAQNEPKQSVKFTYETFRSES